MPPLLCLWGGTAALGSGTKETPSGHSLEHPAQLRGRKQEQPCASSSRESCFSSANGMATHPALRGHGGQDRCSPTAGCTHLCHLGFRVALKADGDPKQGSFGGQSAVIPETTTLHGRGEHLQQTAQSRLCKLLATCTVFTLMSQWRMSSTVHSQQALGN